MDNSICPDYYLTHPDRKPNLSSSERQKATEEFQKVADAYDVLIDPIRRKEYDQWYKLRNKPGGRTQEGEGFDPMKFFQTFFGSKANDEGTERREGRPDPDVTFASVFEDMMRPEVERTLPIWKMLGTASGATMGFILGSLPGLALGTVAGNRLGAIRDAKGKSVYAVFSELDGSQKATILKGLAMKVLGHGLS